MFEKFTSADSNDFRQRYLGTYGFFRREGRQKLLVKIAAIDRVVSFVDKDGITYTLNPDTPNDIGFEFIPPKAAWHNTPQGAFLVRRVPARQWLRGISPKNTNIGTPWGHGARVDFTMLGQLYEDRIAKEKAFADFKAGSGTKTFALSDQFAISTHQGGKLLCLDSVIGEYKETNKVAEIQLYDQELWMTEIRDAFRRSNMEMRFIE